MDKKTLRYINGVLSNDEVSTDSEIKKIFVSQGIDRGVTEKAVALRGKFFINNLFELTKKDLY